MNKIKCIGMIVFLGCISLCTQGQTLQGKEIVQDSLNSVDKMMELREVVAKGNLPHTRLKGGSMITRIQGTSLAESGTLGEMLVKVPGMTGTEGAPEVLGKGNPLIYINGRLMRDDSELKRLRSDEIRDVEVINTPGAQYDATVKAVVRIRTKKAKGDGLGIDFAATDNQDLQYAFNTPTAQLGMNYRKNGVDVFGSVYYTHFDYRQYSSLENVTYTDKVFKQMGPYTMKWMRNYLKYTAGSNWQIAENHSVGVRVDLTHYLNGTNKVIYDEDVLEDGKLIDHLFSDQTSHETKPLGWLTTAYYNGTVGKLNIDFNFDFMTTGTDTKRENTEESTIDDDFVKSETSTHSRLFASKMVLSYPVWKGTLETGAEISLVNRYNTYWIDKSSIANTDADIKENTIAAFAEYGLDFGRYGSLKAGLRYEHVLLDSKDRLRTDNLYRLQDEFFPTASYSVALGKVQMGLSYGLQTNRPSFFAMNDAITYISRYSYQAGNAQLKNEIINDLTFNASWKWLTFTASYNRCRDAIIQWAYIQPNDAVLIKHTNLDKSYNIYNAYLAASPKIGFWSLNASVGAEKQDLWIDVEDERVPERSRRVYYDQPVYIFNAFNNFDLGKNWRFDINIMYKSHGAGGVVYNDYNNCRLGFVLQKSFLQDKALTVRAAVVDVLHRNHANEYLDIGYYEIQQNNKFSTHKLTLNMIYRFNSVRSKYKGTGAGKDVQQRMTS